MIPITYADDFVEAAVLEAERVAPADRRRVFRYARNAAYQIVNVDAREIAFRDVHCAWFRKFGLNVCVEQILGEQADLQQRVQQCRVLQASRGEDAGADLFDYVGAGKTGRLPLLVVRLRPAMLLDAESLTAFLRHELMHVSDMLEPRFGYRRTLPVSDYGPAADTLVRDRYRTLWDVTIDGRLSRRGKSSPASRALRHREFAKAFRMLGDDTDASFEGWFDRVDPTHDAIVEFALHPPRQRDRGQPGHCPLCRFPVAVLEPRPDRMSPETLRLIEREHPEWHVADGLCAQCLDLYEAQRLSDPCAS
jgi:hypothetical protein